MFMKLFLLCCTIIFVLSTSPAQTGIETRDTIPTFMIDAVVVTSDRMTNTIVNTTNSVSYITQQEVRQLPVQNLSEVMQTLPGFFVVNKDGLGRQPIVNSRGYYGGGEAEYCLVLVDSKPINDIETGLVNWNLIPLSNISAIEVSHGASSPLYGDAALGGVINVITKNDVKNRTNVFLHAGSYNSYTAGARTIGTLNTIPYQVFLSNENTNGFREGSHWRGTTAGGDMSLRIDDVSTLKLSSVNQWTFFNDPGPLTEQEFSNQPESRSPYYKPDGGPERRNQVQAFYANKIDESSELSSTLYYNYKSSNIRRTFVNPIAIIDDNFQPTGSFYDSTEFGDTKERQLKTHEVGLNIKYARSFQLAGQKNSFVAGVDGSASNALSSYDKIDVGSGFRQDYLSSNSYTTSGEPVVSGHASRQKYAIYVSDQVRISNPLTLTIGARFDVINDRYRGDTPDTSMTTNANAFSPKLGLNYRFIENASMSGSFYMSWNRSFKAPTIDQLSDQRPIDIRFYKPDWDAFIPFSLSFSNMSLQPQRSTTIEVGTYDKLVMSQYLYAELALAVYQLDAKDEIDFDLSTYRYGNISQSRHRGIEAGVKMYWLPNISVSLNYTLNDVRFREGDVSGNYLKGIPRDVWSMIFSYSHYSGVKGSMILNSLQKTYLDDENSTMLPDFSTVSAKLSYSVMPITVFIESSNLFNRRYSSTGYLLNGTTYLYPAAGRTIRGGIEIEL